MAIGRPAFSLLLVGNCPKLALTLVRRRCGPLAPNADATGPSTPTYVGRGMMRLLGWIAENLPSEGSGLRLRFEPSHYRQKSLNPVG